MYPINLPKLPKIIKNIKKYQKDQTNFSSVFVSLVRRQLNLVVFARLNVGTHQTYFALNTDSITGKSFDNDLDSGLILEEALDGDFAVGGPAPESIVVVSNGLNTWGKGRDHDASKRRRPRMSRLKVPSLYTHLGRKCHGRLRTGA